MASGTIKAVLSRGDVANNLTTSTAGKVLDASQGKILSDQITLKELTSAGTQADFDSRFTTLAGNMANGEEQEVKIQTSASFGVIQATIYLGTVRRWRNNRIYVDLTSANNSVTGINIGSGWEWRSLDDQIANYVSILNVTGESQSVASGNFELTITPSNIPSGYFVRGIVGWNIGARNHVSVTAVQYYSGNVHIFGVNNSGSSLSFTPEANLLLIKD